MKKKALLWALALLLSLPTLVGAAEPSKVAVFPFEVFSQEPLEHLRAGLQEMLAGKLKGEGVTVLDVQETSRAVQATGKPLDLTLARSLDGKLGADFAVFGSLTKIGARVSLDLKVVDVMGVRRPQSVFVEGAGVDALTPLIERLAREVGAQAAGREQVADIQVKGNRRIEAEAVKAVLKTKAGGAYSPVRLDEDLRAVWKMGYFDDVRFETSDGPQGKTVVISVVEKPVVREVAISGNKAVDDKDLREQMGFKP
jgi:outer membrane protein insertion porin family